MSKKKKVKTSSPRNLVAMGMIAAGTGRKQIFTSRAEKRSKDAKHSWQRDHTGE
jgi:hypothetical protein